MSATASISVSAVTVSAPVLIVGVDAAVVTLPACAPMNASTSPVTLALASSTATPTKAEMPTAEMVAKASMTGASAMMSIALADRSEPSPAYARTLPETSDSGRKTLTVTPATPPPEPEAVAVRSASARMVSAPPALMSVVAPGVGVSPARAPVNASVSLSMVASEIVTFDVNPGESPKTMLLAFAVSVLPARTSTALALTVVFSPT